MLRACFAIATVAVALPLAASLGCNDVETTPAPDAAPPPCEPGPFVFDSDGHKATAPPANSGNTSANSCSADGTNIDAVNKLPRGGFYPVGWTFNLNGTRDDQGDCKLQTVCKCIVDETTPPSPAPVDAGADADAAVTPAPQPTPTDAPHWLCQ